MANSFATPTIVVNEALTILENNLVFGRLVDRRADSAFAAGSGATVNVRKRSSIAARQFAGSSVSQDAIAEVAVPVVLDHHMYVQIPLTTMDSAVNIKDLSQQVIEPAMVGHAQAIDAAIAALYRDVPYSTAMGGTKAVADIAAVGKELSLQKVPLSGRNLVMDPTSQAGYMVLDAFLNADKRNTDGAIRDAEMGRVLGLDCYMDQNIVTHVKGTVSSGSASGTAGESTVALASLSGATHTLKHGDVFTIAGDTQPYVVTADKTASASAIAACPIYPALKTSPSSAAITIVDTAGFNAIAFGQGAFCLASRPLAAPEGGARAVNQLQNITGGPGVEIHKTAGGIGIAVARSRQERSAPGESTPEDCTGGDLQSLSIVLGTKDEDEWDRAEGKQLVMSVITDIGWDSGGGNLVGRIRTLHFDKCGKLVDVGPEGDWVVLVPTESCSS